MTIVRGISPMRDGKLRCGRCKQRVPAHLMTRVDFPRSSADFQWYCPSCNQRRRFFKGRERGPDSD